MEVVFTFKRNSPTNCENSLTTCVIASLWLINNWQSDSVLFQEESGRICAAESSKGIIQLNKWGTVCGGGGMLDTVVRIVIFRCKIRQKCSTRDEYERKNELNQKWCIAYLGKRSMVSVSWEQVNWRKAMGQYYSIKNPTAVLLLYTWTEVNKKWTWNMVRDVRKRLN